MKLKFLVVAVLALATFVGCSTTQQETQTTTPEIQEESVTEALDVRRSEIAQDKGTLVTEISFKDGIPVDVQIDFIQDGQSKYELAANGDYVMVEGSDNTWDKQVDAVEAYLIANNFDLSGIVADESGKTDVISGVSIKVIPLLEGVEALLSQGDELEIEVKRSEIAQDKGTLITEITFANGQPIDVMIDFLQDGQSKYELAANGDYVMVEGSDNTWDKQVDEVVAYLKANNFDLSGIVADENGKTDVISGVSIKVMPLLEGVEELLAQ